MCDKANGSKRLIVSIHVPKTGGTTFAHYLKRQFGDKVMYCYPCPREWHLVYAWDWEELERKKDFLSCVDHQSSFTEIKELVQEHGIECVHGHLEVGHVRFHFPAATYVTWLRDPVERTLSHWDYSKQNLGKCPPPIRCLAEQGRFREFVRLTANVQTACLEPFALGDFKFVGITENFDASLRRFEEVFGLARQDVPRHNVDPEKRGTRYDLPPRISRCIRRHNRADERLYRAALSLRHDCRICSPLAVHLRRALSTWSRAPLRGVWALSRRVGRSIKERTLSCHDGWKGV